MITFRSEVFPDFFPDKLNYSRRSVFIGSCFTENIGKKVLSLKFPTLINPFGILYNPISVARCLELCIKPVPFEKTDLFFFNEKWLSFLHHGKFSNTDFDFLLNHINTDLSYASTFIKESSLLFITFGTSWVYRYKKTMQVVANCHKIPSSEFDHYTLSVDEICLMYQNLLEKIHQFNPDLKIIFTVSPVRHWKNGPVNNQLSKATLIIAIQEIIKRFNFAFYFPAYEIMIDDLRDYRFYDEDLFHPNKIGIDYIWDKFKECYIFSDALALSERIEKVIKAVSHKPFYPNTLAYQKFIEVNLKNIEQLNKEFPQLDFASEISFFKDEYRKYFGEK